MYSLSRKQKIKLKTAMAQPSSWVGVEIVSRALKEEVICLNLTRTFLYLRTWQRQIAPWTPAV